MEQDKFTSQRGTSVHFFWNQTSGKVNWGLISNFKPQSTFQKSTEVWFQKQQEVGTIFKNKPQVTVTLATQVALSKILQAHTKCFNEM